MVTETTEGKPCPKCEDMECNNIPSECTKIDKDAQRVGKNHRVCFNCKDKCEHEEDPNKCDKLDKFEGLMDKWL